MCAANVGFGGDQAALIFDKARHNAQLLRGAAVDDVGGAIVRCKLLHSMHAHRCDSARSYIATLLAACVERGCDGGSSRLTDIGETAFGCRCRSRGRRLAVGGIDVRFVSYTAVFVCACSVLITTLIYDYQMRAAFVLPTPRATP